MPKRKEVRKPNDNLARRLSYKSAGENGEANDLEPPNRTIDSHGPLPRNDNKEVADDIFADDPDEMNYPGSEENLDYVFPLVVYILLAVIVIILFVVEICIQKFLMPLTDYLHPILMSLALGFVCTALSWMVTFSDSLHPGSYPPTPISPQKLRKRSGHTFHSSYVICLGNGIVTFMVSLWYLTS